MTDLNKMREFFLTGATQFPEVRKKQLKKFLSALEKYEDKIQKALWNDLKKSVAESYITETGFIKSEIRMALRNLRQWMKPEKVSTNLVNRPSTSKIVRQPKGVVLIIGPWNYPIQLCLAPLVCAIAAGNCAVVKPSELAPASSALMAEMIRDLFSPEYVDVVEGEGAAVVPDLINRFRFDHIFYTGSTTVGKAISVQAASQLIPVTLELGGKSPVIVEPDAPIPVTARRICLSKFSNAGQMCIAPDYVVAHTSVAGELVAALTHTIHEFYGVDPSVSADFGRVLNEKRFDILASYLKQGKVATGGQTNRFDLYIAPTILTDVSLDDPIMKEEIFGPILPVLTYKDDRELQNILDHNPDPLALYIFTANVKKARALMARNPSGGACINNTAVHFLNNRLPFGGIRNSGLGTYHGRFGFETFSHQKAVMETPTWFDPSLKYPPYERKLGWIRRLMG